MGDGLLLNSRTRVGTEVPIVNIEHEDWSARVPVGNYIPVAPSSSNPHIDMVDLNMGLGHTEVCEIGPCSDVSASR